MLPLSRLVITAREVEARKHQQRTEKVMRGILPGFAYRQVVQFGESEPQYYPDAILFFSDFAGFTRIAAALTPRRVIEELSDVFHHFDTIMREHNCDRIETIGDAYLAVAGMSDASEEHTNRGASAVSMAGPRLPSRSTLPPETIPPQPSIGRYSLPA